MFCQHCGNPVKDDSMFCPHCGVKLADSSTAACSQAPFPEQTAYSQSIYDTPAAPELPMKWFNFLIYFSLFLGAVLNFIYGVMALTGAHYNTEGQDLAALVYNTFPGLRTVDILYGIAAIALAALGIVARFRLSGRYANGPKFLYALYIVSAAIVVLYTIALTACISDVMDSSEIVDFNQTFSQLIGSVLMVVVNMIYFKKRRHMFVN